MSDIIVCESRNAPAGSVHEQRTAPMPPIQPRSHSNHNELVVPNVANLVALSNLGVECEPERSAKRPTETPLKVRRPLEKSKTTLLAHTESNSGQTKSSTEGRLYNYFASFDITYCN
jgi:hypothetical protein